MEGDRSIRREFGPHANESSDMLRRRDLSANNGSAKHRGSIAATNTAARRASPACAAPDHAISAFSRENRRRGKSGSGRGQAADSTLRGCDVRRRDDISSASSAVRLALASTPDVPSPREHGSPRVLL
mmetsp:Transcript_10789/g.23400  ORF Transcript_10789/g.23400 Transcript_10789/m.23400 type:complete len:128 (-) Transcript_10789:191-574(-)